MDHYPIPIPARLPLRISPCPIVEAIFELRFTTEEPWRTLPGLLASQIREKYPQSNDLPMSAMPDELRRQDAALQWLPLTQFAGPEFVVQLGPRVVSLVTKTNQYPGWRAIESELEWLLDRIGSAGFIAEGERLGVRYIDFFPDNLFPELVLGVTVGDQDMGVGELQVTAALRRGSFSYRLSITNGAIVNSGAEPRRGSVLDIDVWLGPLDFQAAAGAIGPFTEAHGFVKELFFGLLKPGFLAKMNPEYT